MDIEPRYRITDQLVIDARFSSNKTPTIPLAAPFLSRIPESAAQACGTFPFTCN